MTPSCSTSNDIPEKILAYLTQRVDLIWHKQVHPLPNWFHLKQAQPLADMDHASILTLMKAKAEGFIALDFTPDWQALWEECQAELKSLGLASLDELETHWPDLGAKYRRHLLHSHKVQAEQTAIEGAVSGFAELISPSVPVKGRFLLIEPGLKSGLKIACCEPDGEIRSHMILFPHEPQNQWQQGQRKLENCVASNKVETIILITGEGYRESRLFIKEWLGETERAIECFRLNGSFRIQLLQHFQSCADDALYATVDAFIPLALTPENVLSEINLKCLYHEPVLTIINQATLSRALEDEWRSIQNRPTSKEMTTDPLFLNPVNRLSDLKKQTTYAGQIINKTEYGYFIDIGIQENGLLHNNQLSNNVSYAIGDVIDVQLLSCNPEKQQYALTVPGKTTKPRKNQNNKASNKTRAIGNSAMADALKAALNKEN